MNDKPTVRGDERDGTGGAEGAAAGPAVPAWLAARRIAVPERAAGQVERPALIEAALPTRRRLTVLKAPGGFGKTTLLAECCRRLLGERVPVAWIAVHEHDGPGVLDTCIAHACRRALGGSGAGAAAGARASASAMPESGGAGPATRTDLAVRDIAALDGPFVAVFDELERLRDPGAAALLDALVRDAPPNLHFAFACRELPAGLDIAGAVLDGRAAMLSSEDLRFSEAEAAAFFRGRLSRAELAAVMSESSGWPFALRIALNGMRRAGPGAARSAGELAGNWIESRLLAGLSGADRRFLVELGPFEWMDAALLDEALQRGDSARRIDAMPALSGLLEPAGDGPDRAWRLHPLVREHCAKRLFRDDPGRFRAVHRRISEALERRGETAAAMRHAAEAGEPALAGVVSHIIRSARPGFFSHSFVADFPGMPE